ncbi:MAG TPA: hypothetical protein VK644_08780 [Chitinophagaceae bacterium]|nr:hypothetical protein [Chitinophagaceae bacterium]
MMAAGLTLSVLEIIVLLFGAIILGITIHFFITSRKSLKATREGMEKTNRVEDEWKLRYFNDTEVKDKELSHLKSKLMEAEENSHIYSIEAEEMRNRNRVLKTELENARNTSHAPQDQEKTIEDLRAQVRQLQQEIAQAPRASHTGHEGERPDYLEQLKEAKNSLIDHNQKINQLLGNIEVIKEKEEIQREMLHQNEELAAEIDRMRNSLSQKEQEINTIKQKEHLTQEMTSMLDNAYNDFNLLQGKIHKLESQLTSSKMMNMEFEDLKEEHSKLTRDLDEQRLKTSALTAENAELNASLLEKTDKLRDVNFQRQQLQKKVAYLEELNNDLQVVSEANKKLENQLRRVGELESMLNVVSEERDKLMERQPEKPM